jgi:uncharacterized protein (UPF0147 family)
MAVANELDEDDSASFGSARTELRDTVRETAETMRESLNAENERVRLRAAETLCNL